MSYLEAATTVLKAARRPMTARDITTAALTGELIRLVGKTPEQTMSATLYVHVRAVPNGKIRRVCEPGPGRARRGSVRWVYVK
jgi:homoserine dehydrogenase